MTFAPSEDSRIVMVPIIDDSNGEGVEQFTARLSVPAGQSGVALGEDIATVEITDDDRKSSCCIASHKMKHTKYYMYLSLSLQL